MIGPAIFDFAAKRAELTPDKVAFEELATGRRVTYRAFNDRAARVAQLLSDEGVREGDRVAVLCRNRIAFFEILFACAKAGAIMVPLSWRAPPAELDGLVADSTPKLLFHGAEDADAARTLNIPARIALDAPDGYDARVEAASPLKARDRWPSGDCWYLIYTSGTTGAPKGVIQTYGMAMANYVNTRQATGLRGEDVMLNFLPLFHTAGINLHTLPLFIAGGTSLIAPQFDPDEMLDLLAGKRLDLFFAVPAIYQQIALHPKFAQVDLSHVRNWGCGGAPLPDVLVETYKARGVRVCNGMGMTETGPTAFLVESERAWDKIGTVGRPQILTSVRIVDADGVDVPEGETGELLFAGPNITPGYWNKPEETARAFYEGGWLRSGDLARRDADGDYFIVGRSKDMYISGGSNVYPAEVENVLAEHPDILEAAIIGVPDERWGEAGEAYVLLRPGHAAPEESDLTQFLRARLAPYKAPKRYVFVPDFPRTAAGKVQKHKLRDFTG
ncbi:MAG: long-chain fatty acid--CoA ligase [Hyphomonadaceae bacterium]|nr:long-chain fatty acid--CoA ligase [Hyphomonadaceae bacterium]